MNKIIIHYGVLGQKWGVRKATQNEKSEQHKKPNYKKIAIITGASLIVVAGTAVAYYAYKKHAITQSTLENALKRGNNLDILETLKKSEVSDILVPKGSILERVSKVAETDFNGDILYASFKKEDKRRYKILFEEQLKTKKLYNIKLSAINDLKAPNDSKQFQLFKKLIEENDEFASSFADQYKSVSNVLQNRSKTADDAYHNFITGIYRSDRPENKIFMNYMKNLGYNALFDTNDAGVWSTSPLIALDPKMNLLIESSKAIGLGEKFVNVLLAKKGV